MNCAGRLYGISNRDIIFAAQAACFFTQMLALISRRKALERNWSRCKMVTVQVCLLLTFANGRAFTRLMLCIDTLSR
jgi:hypothetical protein